LNYALLMAYFTRKGLVALLGSDQQLQSLA